MLLHVTISTLRTDVHPSAGVLRRLFTRLTRNVDEVSLSVPGEAHGVQTPASAPSEFTLPPKADIKPNVLQRRGVYFQRQSRNNSTDTSDLPRNIKLSRYLDFISKRDFSLTAERVPLQQIKKRAIPSTKWELYQDLLRLISLSPPAPFSRLMRLHQRHPTLQSPESYNLLLQLSIRHSYHRQTRHLFRLMSINNVEPDVNTEKLVVRHLMTSGKWTRAWQQTIARYQSVPNIPMRVLLEFIAPGTRRPMKTLFTARTGSIRRARIHSAIPLNTLLLLLHRFPLISIQELARLPPRVISYAVRGLLRNGYEKEAILLTENHLRSLPPQISLRRLEFARDLIHLHLSSGERKLATYKRKRRLVEYLMTLDTNLRPNAHTVFLLMRYLKRSWRCGVEAYLLYKEYRARWGVAVESQDVRRRVVSYALRQRKIGIVKEIALENKVGESTVPSRQRAVLGGAAEEDLIHPRKWRTMYPRKGKGSRFWRRVLVRALGNMRRTRRKHRAERLRQMGGKRRASYRDGDEPIKLAGCRPDENIK